MDETGFYHTRPGTVPLLCVRATATISHLLQDSGPGGNIHISYLHHFWIDMREATLQLSLSSCWRNSFAFLSRCLCKVFCKTLLPFCVVSISAFKGHFSKLLFLNTLGCCKKSNGTIVFSLVLLRLKRDIWKWKKVLNPTETLQEEVPSITGK